MIEAHRRDMRHALASRDYGRIVEAHGRAYHAARCAGFPDVAAWVHS